MLSPRATLAARRTAMLRSVYQSSFHASDRSRMVSMRLALLLALILPTVAHAQFGVRRGAQLFMMLSDGSEMRPLVRVPDKIWHGSPDLSHNGRWIAFDASPELYGGDPAHVYVATLDKPEGRLYD